MMVMYAVRTSLHTPTSTWKAEEAQTRRSQVNISPAGPVKAFEYGIMYLFVHVGCCHYLYNRDGRGDVGIGMFDELVSLFIQTVVVTLEHS